MVSRVVALWMVLTVVAVPAAGQPSESRVEREASNPMRRIIEAAKIKPKPRAAEAPAAAASARPASAPPRPSPAPSAAVAAAPTTEVPIEVLPSPPPGAPRSTIATVELAAEPVTLTAVWQVDPVVPAALGSLVESEARVLVAFNVLPDGRVAEATVRRSSHPELDAAVLEAVRQWRYRPIAVSTPHEVEVVLRAGP